MSNLDLPSKCVHAMIAKHLDKIYEDTLWQTHSFNQFKDVTLERLVSPVKQLFYVLQFWSHNEPLGRLAQ